MKLDAPPSLPISGIFSLVPLGLSMLMFGTACGASDGNTRPRGGGTASSIEPSDSAPAAGDGSAGNQAAAEAASMNAESIADGLAPVFDGTSAAEAAAAPGAAMGDDSDAQSPSDDTAGSDGTPDAGAPPSSDPSVDENLVFIQQDGFQTTYFALDCRSIAEDGSSVDGATNTALPVGGGYTLECSIERFPSRATTDVLSATNEVWCALGELTSYEPGGDDRLTITIATGPDVAPAVLIATREGEEISVAQATAFGGRLWPLWIEASYDVVDLARAEQGKVCDQVFGL